MSSQSQISGVSVYDFGPFTLDPARRVLLRDGQEVSLGGRALDILCILVERGQEIVSKRELLEAVWPGAVVEEANLRVQISNLRRVLDPTGQIILGIPRQGYRFDSPVGVRRAVDPSITLTPVHQDSATGRSLTRVIGRDDVIETIVARLADRRLVTLIGPGGIGKTTVARAAADALAARGASEIVSVDLTTVVEPGLVPSALASALGLPVLSDNPMPRVFLSLNERPVVILLDNCEHVIDASAFLVEELLQRVPNLKILATSREPLRTQGEWALRLGALDFPQVDQPLPPSRLMEFSAIQLLVERADAHLAGYVLDDEDAVFAQEICRRLDGIPLAIELAASRLEALGMSGVAAQVGEHFELVARGRRTALPRHQTMNATLDWSLNLLTEPQRETLLRLAIFRGWFLEDGAEAVAAFGALSAAEVADAVAELAAKSLVQFQPSPEGMVYRLFETTRAYALKRLQGDAFVYNETAFRHALHTRERLREADLSWPRMTTSRWLAKYGRWIEDVRAALTWTFSADGQATLGVSLTAVSASLWFQLSLVNEYRTWLENVGPHLTDIDLDTQAQLHTAMAHAVVQSVGAVPEVEARFLAALSIAEEMGAAGHQARALWGLSAERVMHGDFKAALDYARRFAAMAQSSGDAISLVVEKRCRALAHHYLGHHEEARALAEEVLVHPHQNLKFSYHNAVHLDQRVAMQVVVARTLWLTGFPDQAAALAEEMMSGAIAADHALTLAYSLAIAICPIAIWRGDLDARQKIDQLVGHAVKTQLTVYEQMGRVLSAVLDHRDGRPMTPLLMNSAARTCDQLATFAPSLLTPLAAARVDAGDVGWCAAEVLRGKALRAKAAGASSDEVVSQLEASRTLAREQGALSFELRSAMSLADEYEKVGQAARGLDLLAGVYERFREGFETVDLWRASSRLLRQSAAGF